MATLCVAGALLVTSVASAATARQARGDYVSRARAASPAFTRVDTVLLVLGGGGLLSIGRALRRMGAHRA